MNKFKPVMFVGTASDVGKSVLATAFCRVLKQEGYQPAPFKAQNMSLNSYVTPEGLELGRAQAVQAEACNIPSHTDMNPVLLKPNSEKSSQIVLNGKPVGNQSAREYFLGNNKEKLFEEAKAAFQRLHEKYSPIVMEGAGSISELNLKKRDISNMRMAMAAGADVYLVADIDKGGVFASVYGSIQLLNPEERKHIKGIIINKFRGDASLFEEGKNLIKDLTGIPVVGLLPYFKDIFIEEEDSVSLKKKFSKAVEKRLNIGVVLLPHISNFTDFSRLERDERVHLFYSHDKEELAASDILILPGTKSTIADLHFLRRKGIAEVILHAHKAGKKVIGICGGYQMMGSWIEDPYQVESEMVRYPGLGLLPVNTILEKEKQTVERTFLYRDLDTPCKGYEVHMGKTIGSGNPLIYFQDGTTDGCWLSDQCWGTYLHGILDNAVVLDDLLREKGNRSEDLLNWADFKQQQYDKLADHLRRHLDLDYMINLLNA
ncbi:cobyric acid synthase [Xanthovirga aplysinae]|uniref:cobyric acid synthase n=1 Tax=Xanthovirga aplysinae TaxID=2529853 RepID=UPI0012BBAFAD|nr:cobyric acid synthase [Xanthovirga aplysinae]MTI32344.1 cobyric acid synthase [Xanthovirga aplysinae]